ncbi:MAG: hypothetical protein JNK78_10310 [Planctomycetes bacterium]|nr:hypothetical protein [Planctomycetota bacterium]
MNRTVSTLLTLVGIAGSYHLVLGRLHLAEIRDLQREIDGSYARYDRAEEEATHVATLKNAVAALAEARDDLQRRTSRDPLSVPTAAQTRSVLEEHGLAVERAEPMGADPSLGMPHQRTRVVATGAFADLFAAITAIENDAVPTRITDLSIQTNTEPARVRTEMTLVRAWSVDR